jgi:hypothetical protein
MTKSIYRQFCSEPTRNMPIELSWTAHMNVTTFGKIYADTI